MCAAIAVLIFVSGLFLPYTVSAQQAVPQIYVRALTVGTISFDQGDTLHGTALLSNEGPTNVAGVVYAVRLVSNYDENGMPVVQHGAIISDPLALAKGEQKSISFDYVLPNSLAGNLGIEVQAMLPSGLALGWQDVRIKVNGTNHYASLENLNVTANGITYPSAGGPTVRPGVSATASVTLINNGSESLSVHPTMRIFERDVAFGVPATEQEARASFEIPAGGNVIRTYPLPDMRGKAGVYVAVIDFKDANGSPVAPQASFRYIIGGPIATIHTVSADKGSVTAGEAVNVTVAFTGRPPELDVEEQPNTGTGELTVKLLNETGALVAESTKTVDIDRNFSETFALAATRSAKELRAEVEITQDGEQLAFMGVLLPPSFTPNIEARESTPGSTNTDIILLGGVAVLLILIAFVLWYAFKRPAALAVIFAFTSLSVLGIGARDALAFVITSQSFSGHIPVWVVPMNIFVNTPSGTYAPETDFCITGTIQTSQCSNATLYGTLTATYNGVPNTLDLTNWDGTAHYVMHDTRFNWCGFKTPAAPGVYRVDVVADTHTGRKAKTTVYEHVTGYQEFTVIDDSVLSCPTGQHVAGSQCVCDGSGDPPVDGQCTTVDEDDDGDDDDNVPAGCPPGTRCLPLGPGGACPLGYVPRVGVCVFSACPLGYVFHAPTLMCTQEQTKCISQSICGQSVYTNKVVNSCTGAVVDDCDARGTDWFCSGGQCVIILPDLDAGTGDITVYPTRIRSNTTARVSWSTSNFNSCNVTENNSDINDNWTGSSDDKISSRLNQRTTYTLTCDGQRIDTATVNIIPVYIEK